MGISLIVALAFLPHAGAWTPVSGADVWEELPAEQRVKAKMGEYSPMLRFKPESSYMFLTPDFIQQGKYQVQNNQYFFRAVMANELENADIAHLREDMPAGSSLEFGKAYARSMSNFEGGYNPSTGILTVSYTVKGTLKSFQLYPYTYGDNKLTSALSDEERGVAGLWHAPEPFPEKLDARTRYKIGGLEGLQRFAREAGASDGAQFSLLDLRIDKSFRMGAITGTWTKSGSIVVLKSDGKEMDFTLSSTGQKLMAGGKAAYEMN